jgi:hypothetical protein
MNFRVLYKQGNLLTRWTIIRPEEGSSCKESVRERDGSMMLSKDIKDIVRRQGGGWNWLRIVSCGGL